MYDHSTKILQVFLSPFHFFKSRSKQKKKVLTQQQTCYLLTMEGENEQCFNPNATRASHSDDEVVLATSCPKKRAGRKKVKETRHPVYRGVRQRNGNRWVCEVRAPNNKSRIWLGTYPTAEMAARAHDVAALTLKGRAACLNFADSAWRLRVPTSTDTRDIQKAAAEAAEAFRGEEEEGESQHNVGESSRINDNIMEVFTDGNQVNNQLLQNNAEYMDDEEVFGMPGLLANMAEGLLLPPPHNQYDTESDCEEFSLWSYSI
ncbi:dehydration-responsive element-binding protein 1A [Beta vulgaris subsp. vulgaris]|uniref:dehydration-responsive element-binding protein 1A n=1 Tax=Beta vulgaris subsp. vulgaris TaxID=3555 RepID=UPI000901CC37|nr:dehydration-responsive element-binding protein 1A [Beta vulgaris subsp. vulgaris]